jgi:RNA polymerase primary sigma factor
MAQPKEPDDRSVHIPEHLIEMINKLVRTSRQMLTEIGREPTLRNSRQSLRCHSEKCASS